MRYQFENVVIAKGGFCKGILHNSNYTPLHWHKHIEVLWLKEGDIEIISQKKSCLLHKDDIFVVSSNDIHGLFPCDDLPVTIAGIQIDPDFCKAFYPHLEKTSYSLEQFIGSGKKQGAFEAIRQCINEICQQEEINTVEKQFWVHGQCNQVVYHLIKDLDYELIEDSEHKVQLKDILRVQRIMDYVGENYMKKISLKTIANEENINLYYLSHFFKEKTGINLKEYIMSVRLINAARQLLESDLKVVTILFACGFADVKGFYRLFKEKFSCTPTEYRKKYRIPVRLEEGKDQGI